MIAEVATVVVLNCACGPHRCTYCKGKVFGHRCRRIPFDVLKCPHCGYPTHSAKPGDRNFQEPK
jgi:hypothetical protein